MTALIIDNLAPIMFVSLVLALLAGYPVAFSLAFVGLFYAVVGIGLGLFEPTFLQLLPERVWQVFSNDTLLAIPFFTFMGLILERSGMAEDLLESVGKLFGPVRGGVAYAVIFVGALLAATTGVVAASVIAMGLISLPVMLRYGYDRRLASGVIAASGTLAQIIPPSLVLIIMADQLGRSVGDMYSGAVVPGLVLTGMYALYVLVVTLILPNAAPPLPAAARSFGPGADYLPVLAAMALPAGLVLWGMITLFAPLSAIDILRGFSGSAADLALAHLTTAGSQMTGLIGGFAVVYLAFVGLLRFASRPIGTAVAVVLALAAAAVLVLGARSLAASAGSIPALSAGVIDWAAGGALWIAGVWPFALAALALAGAGWSLAGAPRRAVAAAVWKIVGDLLPPLILIFLVLGTIFQGIATPTDGGAMGATGALLLAAAKRRLSFDLLRQAVERTARLSTFVVFILIGARVFSLTFFGVNGHIWVGNLLLSLPGGQLGFLLFVNAVVFVLAFFLDFFELSFIVVPLLIDPANKLGVDLVWLGVLLGINMQTSFMHPPFGFALFYLRSVAPREPFADAITGVRTAPVTTAQIYWGAIPFVIIQLIMVGLAIAVPDMILRYKTGPDIDPSKVEITLPPPGGGDAGGGVPPPPAF